MLPEHGAETVNWLPVRASSLLEHLRPDLRLRELLPEGALELFELGLLRTVFEAQLLDRAAGVFAQRLGLLGFDFQPVDFEAQPGQVHPARDAFLEGLLLSVGELFRQGELLDVLGDRPVEALEPRSQLLLLLGAGPQLAVVFLAGVGEAIGGACNLSLSTPPTRPHGRRPGARR